MKAFGWVLVILGSLGCVLAAIIGVATADTHGTGAIGIAIAGVGALFAGIRLIERD